MRFRVDGIGEIAWWVCGYADQVTVIKPPELRDRVEQMHRDAASLYAAEPGRPVVVKVKEPLPRPPG
jgi:proteasome accessory factor B